MLSNRHAAHLRAKYWCCRASLGPYIFILQYISYILLVEEKRRSVCYMYRREAAKRAEVQY